MTKMLTSSFTEWLSSPDGTKFSKQIEDMSKEELNDEKDGRYYKNTSRKPILAAIDRFLRSPPSPTLCSLFKHKFESFQNHLFSLNLNGKMFQG